MRVPTVTLSSLSSSTLALSRFDKRRFMSISAHFATSSSKGTSSTGPPIGVSACIVLRLSGSKRFDFAGAGDRPLSSGERFGAGLFAKTEPVRLVGRVTVELERRGKVA